MSLCWLCNLIGLVGSVLVVDKPIARWKGKGIALVFLNPPSRFRLVTTDFGKVEESGIEGLAQVGGAVVYGEMDGIDGKESVHLLGKGVLIADRADPLYEIGTAGRGDGGIFFKNVFHGVGSFVVLVLGMVRTGRI